ncbi:hypothetical protein BDP27DRAFT_1421114 [Rhodocollybia butyracea]|uniref:Uncharacterized protein n=1 Tax=Rhodocollybia butyracea TaxID=206335 RepID=A0A9P5PWG3_9AGAR|nr:hypothetical protein BDP27DRAFT_1421114 [Rhodocollybia butyracea]
MEQSSKASSNNNQPGVNYSEEMLSLMHSIHSMMQAREEREASVLRTSSGPPHTAIAPVTSQLTSNISVPVMEPISTEQAGAHPAPASDPLASTLTSILAPLHEAILDLQHVIV